MFYLIVQHDWKYYFVANYHICLLKKHLLLTVYFSVLTSSEDYKDIRIYTVDRIMYENKNKIAFCLLKNSKPNGTLCGIFIPVQKERP